MQQETPTAPGEDEESVEDEAAGAAPLLSCSAPHLANLSFHPHTGQSEFPHFYSLAPSLIDSNPTLTQDIKHSPLLQYPHQNSSKGGFLYSSLLRWFCLKTSAFSFTSFSISWSSGKPSLAMISLCQMSGWWPGTKMGQC